MVQSWGVSRFFGQLSMLELSIDRAGAALACAFWSTGRVDAALIRARHHAAVLDRGFIAQMRVLLSTTAVSALAVLLLILL